VPAGYLSRVQASSHHPQTLMLFIPSNWTTVTSKYKINNVRPYMTFSKQTSGPRDLIMTDTKFYESIANKIHQDKKQFSLD